MVSQRVRVVARVRPLKPTEVNDESENSIITSSAQELKIGSHSFRFDRVYGPGSTQQDVFQSHFVEEVDNVLDGENSTIIAFGQTAAGKTYTLTGPSNTENEEGIIPRSLRRIFENQKCPLMISYVEIHNERLRDLLDKGSKISMLGDGTIKGASITTVNTMRDALNVLRQGESARTVASTCMNDASSRSHAILTAELRSGARLVLVDLAGSEVVKKTGASGQILEEAGCINKSLTSLAMVISALSDVRKPAHIPFRDSKLTQILQPALIGNSRLTLIINCSPAKIHLSESLSSLRFGTRCKSIRVNASVENMLSTVASLVFAKSELEMIIRRKKLGIPMEATDFDYLSKLPECEEVGKLTSAFMGSETSSKVDSAEAQASNMEEGIATLDQILGSVRAQINCLQNSGNDCQISDVVMQKTEEYMARLDHQMTIVHTLNDRIMKIFDLNNQMAVELATLRNKSIRKRAKEYLEQLGAEVHDCLATPNNKRKRTSQFAAGEAI